MNPWTQIPDRSPYVLDGDKPYVDAFNEVCTDEKKRVNLLHPPEPRLGPTDAPLVLLQSNPSYGADEAEGPRDHGELLESLRTLSDEDRPHKGALAANGWWSSRLRELRSEVGEGPLV